MPLGQGGDPAGPVGDLRGRILLAPVKVGLRPPRGQPPLAPPAHAGGGQVSVGNLGLHGDGWLPSASVDDFSDSSAQTKKTERKLE